jgi:hypothetical protein
MTFDAKSLLTRPCLTVDGLIEALTQISQTGMGGAPVTTADGQPIAKIELFAHGEGPARFILSAGPPPGFQREVKR